VRSSTAIAGQEPVGAPPREADLPAGRRVWFGVTVVMGEALETFDPLLGEVINEKYRVVS
jgi:hypothetical protein